MNLTLLENPIELNSERFRIQSMTLADWPLFKALQANEQLMAYIGNVLQEDVLKEKFGQRIAPWNHNEEHWFTLKIEDKSTNQPVGSIGFRISDIDNKRAEIGYLLLEQHHGKGVIPEVAKQLITFLFKTIHIHKIVAYCFKENTGSWKVMEKLGMKKEAHFIAHTKLRDEWHDELMYSLINTHNQ